MKILLPALLLLHIGCASINAEGPAPAEPPGAGAALSGVCELAPQPEPGGVKELHAAFGVVGGHLTMTEQGASAEPRALWPVAAAPLLWSRVVSMAGGGYAVVLRQRDVVLVGTLDSERKPLGELARIPARHVIGTPAVAATGDVAIVTWAQGESTGCTSLVGTVVTPGERPAPAERIAGTECNEEHMARAPFLSGASDGRFVLAFTEIGVWSTQTVAMLVAPSEHEISGRVLSKIVAPSSEQLSAHQLAQRLACSPGARAADSGERVSRLGR